MKKYESITKEVYYEEVLDNGLTVLLYPKNDYQKTYVTFSTKFGSVDNKFIINDEQFNVIDGTAHFLEHKMFEKEDGDVFNSFAKHSAQANAFTSFNQTTYLFSTTNDISSSLEILLDFVQTPYFTDQTVDKEKGIIEEEINMYQDDASFRSFFGLLQTMYENHPVTIDIAGSVASIQDITKEHLYDVHKYFYHPQNMVVVIVGNFDYLKASLQIKKNQEAKVFENIKVLAVDPLEPNDVYLKSNTIEMDVAVPKVLVGLKLVNHHDIKEKFYYNVFLELMYSKSSLNYGLLLDAGIINDSFTYEAMLDRDYALLVVGCETTKVDEFIDFIVSSLDNFSFVEDDFIRVRNSMIGSHIMGFNYVEGINRRLVSYFHQGISYFDIYDILNSLNFSDFSHFIKNLDTENKISTFKVLPISK